MNDFVFKLGQKGDEDPISISAEEAFSLFEASPEESAVNVSKDFNDVYQLVKGQLFKDSGDTTEDKSKYEAYNKLKLWSQSRLLPKDYLADLITLLQSGNLTGEEVRFINKQTSRTASLVQEKITEDYIRRSIMKMNAVEEGEETLIMAEEIQ